MRKSEHMRKSDHMKSQNVISYEELPFSLLEGLAILQKLLVISRPPEVDISLDVSVGSNSKTQKT